MSDWQPAKILKALPNGGVDIRVQAPRATAPALPKSGGVLVQIKQGRSLAHHNKYWALLDQVVAATGKWPSTENCHLWIKVKLGMYEPVYFAVEDELIVYNFKSIDFARMGQKKFEQFYEQAMAALAIETGIDPEQIGKKQRVA